MKIFNIICFWIFVAINVFLIFLAGAAAENYHWKKMLKKEKEEEEKKLTLWP